MNDHQLHEAIGALRAELEKPHAIDTRAREHILDVLKEIDALMEKQGNIPPHRQAHLIDRLRESARHFEESHLTLTFSLGRLIDILSNMGI
ncbi:MAG: DUF4404 family protein [Candidatus Aureabacteria bacterium]|nr:DUF4404 family protein [Candidatus Auribacterota bacterium]